MSRLTRDLAGFVAPPRRQAHWWLALAVAPLAGIGWGFPTPRWVVMWLLAFVLWAVCKYVAWMDAAAAATAPASRKWAYFLAWPGMDAAEFVTNVATRPLPMRWVFATAKTFFGAALVWLVARTIPEKHPLLIGWTGLVGLVFLLHFGLFHLLALCLQERGVNAQPIMRAPLLARSISEFWNRRWNVAFNQLMRRFVFLPLVRRTAVPVACMATFLASGLIHDLVISVPAGGGYGLPAAYFLAQGCAVLLERSEAGRRLGLRGGWRGRLFMVAVTAGPVAWLFHPPFVNNVILPMLTAIGATKR